MSDYVVDGLDIVIGYPWAVQIEFIRTPAESLFPAGSLYTAQVRREISDVDVLTILTPSIGVQRVSDSEIIMQMTKEQTTLLPAGSVVLDLVRTDTVSPIYVGVFFQLAVVQPVTRL